MGIMGTMGITIPNLLKFPNIPNIPSIPSIPSLRPLRPLRGWASRVVSAVSALVRNHLNCTNGLISQRVVVPYNINKADQKSLFGRPLVLQSVTCVLSTLSALLTVERLLLLTQGLLVALLEA